jgi:cobalamin biosynthesis protein CobT
MPSRRGRLDCRRLHAVTVNDPAAFLTHRRKPAVNTAVHVLLDASSSMRQRIDLACQCCAVLAQALRQTGVAVAMTAFPGASAFSGAPPWRRS